jgi:hypothetical protein
MTTEAIGAIGTSEPSSVGGSMARRVSRVDARAVATWALAGGLVLFLGLDGGGYDIVVHSQIGVLVWWIILVAAVCGLLPAGRLGRAGWAGLALFAGFVAWTAVSATWSLSSERSLQEVSRVASYLGVLVLALAIHRDREHAVRHTIHAVAAAITVITALAVLSRMSPGTFPAARTTAAFLPGTQSRLGWPLNYWNALAALVALGLPLVLSIATSARTLAGQAAAAAAIPLLVLCDYLTFSRGGAIASVVGVLAYLALAPKRLPRLATLLVGGASGAVLVAGATQRDAIERGVTSHAATAQGETLLVWVLVVCAGVALAQVGIGLAARRGQPAWLWRGIPSTWARRLLAVAVALAVIAVPAAGAPSKLEHAWNQFKNRNAVALHQDSLARYGTVSGNGRYDYWKVAVASTSGHVLQGAGPGTFQLLWEPRAPYSSYVVNAHSLYIETLAEVGAVGLALLIAFLMLVLGAGITLAVRSGEEARAFAAGASAALLAFLVSAIADWVWQVPVLPVAFLLLAAAVLAPAQHRAFSPKQRITMRVAAVVVAVACLVAIGVPLGTASSVSGSQRAAAAGNTTLALADAGSAARLEPGAATPQIQEALVFELRRDLPDAVRAARRATRNEPLNWTAWLVLSRLEAESGHARAAVAAYGRARADNPTSSVFQR